MLIVHLLYCSLSLLIQTDTGYPLINRTPTTGGSPSPDVDFLFLLLSIDLLALTIFFLYQAASVQRWITKEGESPPNPNAGLTLAWGIGCWTIVSWVIYVYIKTVRFYDEPGLVRYFIDHPKRFAPALLLSSCMAGFLSLFKFAMVWSFFRSNSAEPSKSPRSPVRAIVGFVFSAISLAASVATLLLFFKLA